MTAPRDITARLALGTAQFGLDYGVTNRTGALSPQASAEILDLARQRGVRLLDTAPAYGDSEAAIGRLDPAGDFEIVTKLPPVGGGEIRREDADALERGFEASLKRLRRDSVYGVLAHHSTQLTLPGARHLVQLFEALRADGRAKRIGFSVYTGADIDAAFAEMTPDIVQLPVSVADQRLIRSGHLDRLRAAGVTIHARSLFLQGALLCSPSALPEFFRPARAALGRITERARQTGVGPLALCLGFALRRAELDRLIIGVASPVQFVEILEAATVAADLPLATDDLGIEDPAILDPSKWPSLEAS